MSSSKTKHVKIVVPTAGPRNTEVFIDGEKVTNLRGVSFAVNADEANTVILELMNVSIELDSAGALVLADSTVLDSTNKTCVEVG